MTSVPADRNSDEAVRERLEAALLESIDGQYFVEHGMDPERLAQEWVHDLMSIVDAALKHERIEGRRDAADAVSELRDEILGKFDNSTTQNALRSIANDWLSQARRAARGSW